MELPLTVVTLKTSGVGKVVNKLRKCTHDGLRKRVFEILEDWKAKFKI